MGRGGSETDRRALGGAVLSGIGFGVFYLALAQTDAASGLWPLVAARGTSIPIAFAIAAALGVAAAPVRGQLGLVAVIGNLDMAANVASALALQRGPVGVTVVLVSLYPAVTAATAMVVLRERLTGRQLAGIGFALAALVALGAGERSLAERLRKQGNELIERSGTVARLQALNENIIESINMLGRLPFPKELSRVPDWAGNHHERLDGSGYPRGLRGEAIQPYARIAALVDDMDQPAEAGDEPTADLLTQRMQVHEKAAWMMRSMLA